MKLVNSVIGLAAAMAVLPSCVCFCAEAEYEAPSDIEVSVGSCEIDRSQLSGDTIVELPVSINNNCGFVSLNVLFELDSRLSFAGDYEAAAKAKKLTGVNIYNCYDSGNTISACFEVSGRSRFTDNGEIGALRVSIPENTPAGEYGISMPDSAGEFEVMIFTYNSNDAMFGRECFSALNGGSIIITDKYHEDQSDSGSNEEENNAQQPAAEAEDTGEKASAVTTAESTTTVTSSTSTAFKTTSTVSSTSSDRSSETQTTAAVTSSVETSSADEVKSDLKKGRNRNMFAPVLAASLLVIGAAVVFVVKKGGKSK
ncbi:hypothetical protein SAMN02910265_02715 [Ruminococcus flavefaciens]|uniref:Cohesin domain-containing protein n=1 Tax=Ruminococcus flavefaciens TaxID=1265 RepID=A0A1H6KTU5_RUMFL|nr:hypothetical protein [Ruminococcus flavefaciens]SEH79120.1 hypothetical protein SAMN02910265_02715 [Ruminococcus flavefaciens]